MREISITLVIALVLFAFSGYVPTYAEEDDEYLCAKNMINEGEEILAIYAEDLNDLFLAETPSSDLIGVGKAYQKQTEEALKVLFDKGLDLDNTKTIDLANSEVANCAYYFDRLSEYTEVLLEIHARESANSKRSFIVVDAMKALNEDLRDFSEDFYNTFPKTFTKMNNNLPCYAKQCL
ncbi:hypothetical protein HOD30_05590 [Candidatus Peregrinibacteria bacterium]|jgi:hypothetical protein|nr:hypothetical protein [Candidatus Peregrinibacteria bacterium]MBT4631494.1 hypothetical protein [Candidatus Peregrinibacteria bacterium]MBT5516477.1 hypothetical protein [Candidatus Peregrinibacteria bacterium]MBT5823883.1 hypothetical protein [Candidatus Peregrinibacteria bacterium]